MPQPLIVIDPRGLTDIFEPTVFAKLQSLGRLEIHEGAGRMPADRLDALLPAVELLIGQSDMPRARLDRAPNLRTIINVETNFLQNVDYETCFERGVHVITPSPAETSGDMRPRGLGGGREGRAAGARGQALL